MALKEQPRLSGFLRAFSTERGQTFVLEKEQVNQLELLKKKKSVNIKKPTIQTSNNENETPTLSWKYFASASANDSENNSKEMRNAYNIFLKDVLKLIGEETSTEELHAAAYQIFDSLSNPLLTEQQKRESIVTFFGLRALDVYKNLDKSVTLLSNWRQSFLTDKEKYDDKKHFDETILKSKSTTEFGSNVEFKFTFNIPISTYDTTDKRRAKRLKISQTSIPMPSSSISPSITPSIPSKEPFSSKALPKSVFEEPAPALRSYWEEAVNLPVGPNWLAEQCYVFLSTTATGSDFTPQELSATLLPVLKGTKSDVELQNTLFDLLGENSFEFIQLLMKKRIEFLTFLSKPPSQQRAVPDVEPSLVGQFKITTENDKLIEKLRKKEQQRKKKGKQPEEETQEDSWKEQPFDARGMREQRISDLVSISQPTSMAEMHLAPAGTLSDKSIGQKILLPEKSTRKQTKKWEEVFVPYTPQAPFQANEKLVPITAFEEFAQLAFRNYKTLNRLQSRLFEAAYKSNENLLVCAPTGAGKTDVAMMTILHEVGQHLMNGVIRRGDFKIVYVAPMKALAAEVTEKFSSRLSSLGLVCKELTGDMQLTKKELTETQIIVTTPEKWDVITRKSGDVALTSMVRLLIIDEVHLLHEDRGPVIEVLVARTLRQVETTQSMIRIVGLSATLPNYKDVAAFLRVNPTTGLFYFDSSYRPVPLDQTFIGVKETNPLRNKNDMTEVCYEKVFQSIVKGNQVMVFVHSRKDTFKSAENLIELAREHGTLDRFSSIDSPNFPWAKKEASKSRNRELKQLFDCGFSIHHAGMLRSDRSLVERMFSEGLIKVLVCTATLAWGVNLPAHTVIIKGTQIYEPKQGTFVELGMLDVMQIFGRAGRPQFDTSGEAFIITTHDKLTRYLALLNQQMPIESQFIAALSDHLNAEIVLGTVTNVKEAITWLSYTYLFIRMIKNPIVYGISYDEKEMDSQLLKRRKDLIVDAARTLDKCRMIVFDEKSGNFSPTDLGRMASHYYINHDTVLTFNEQLRQNQTEEDILGMVTQSSEFENIMLREEEMAELETLTKGSCFFKVKGGSENKHGKINVLLQAYLSHAPIDGFALVSDSAYIVQNMGRILRGTFDTVLKKGWASSAERLLTLCKMVERRVWHFQHPLRQFSHISPEILSKLESKHASLEKLWDMTANEIGQMVGHPRLGQTIKKYVNEFPSISLSATIQPITRTVLRVQLEITAQFEWNDRIHSSVEPWWIWIEDAENEHIYHTEYFLLNKKQKDETHKLVFTIPIFEPLPSQYYVHAISDRWLGAETLETISFKHLILPHQHPPHTELLDLQPLPVTALHNPEFEVLYKFSHFNPIQTQIFHTMYHTETNVLLGAPTGSGKTIAAELAMLKLFRDTPHLKVVYIGPLKALVRERLNDWSVKFGQKLKKKVVELTGDYTPNVRALQTAEIVLTTPEKWDGISRNWQNRSYVKAVGLVVLDEIHLLGDERGPILEVIVSRMRYISSQTDNPVRIVGLSTALANARDLGDWLGIEKTGLFNFRPSVRPVPLEAHIQGYPGKHYCPRMATMNKPTYAAITTHSPDKPVIVFVSSRRQTRLTALDLIALSAADEHPRQWLHMNENELDNVLNKIKDPNLRHTLPFGIALHHAGLTETDKALVEDLFEKVKIQILVSTSTLAWGVNLPAHLVVIKGTEYFDPKTKRYVDFPITDVLQMMGRAGRPQYDTLGKAVIMVHEPKKNFYKKFLYEPFPVESSLPKVLHDHLNAEIVAGTITSKQDAIDYLTWTYFFRRLMMNPAYYDLEDTSFEAVNQYLSEKVDSTVSDLERAQCISIEDDMFLFARTMGRIASYYYLHYTTSQLFVNEIGEENDIQSLLITLTKTAEYEDLPVRHNEEKLNEALAAEVPWPVDSRTFESPHTKANLLLQAHFSRIPLPISDYETDTKSVLDQAVRIIQAMVDVSADGGWLFTALNCMQLLQMVLQGLWFTDSTLFTLPHFNPQVVKAFYQKNVECLAELIALPTKTIQDMLQPFMSASKIRQVLDVVSILPSMDVKFEIQPQVQAGSEVQIKVEINRLNKLSPNGAYTPLFPKRKDEGWWLVLGDPVSKELIALRRLNFPGKKTTTTLSFEAPEREGRHSYELYFMSDCYFGLDQQYSVPFHVV